MSHRKVWVLELRHKKYGWDSSVPSFLTRKEAIAEMNKLAKAKVCGDDPYDGMRVRKYLPVTELECAKKEDRNA